MTTFKEELEKIHEGLVERLKSPFILTFILVWIVNHWQVAYTLFHFNADCDLQCRLAIIKDYIKDHDNGIGMFWIPLGWASLSYIGYLISALIFEFVYEGYAKWGRALVYWVIDRNKLINRTLYNDLDVKFKQLEKDFQSLKENKEGLANDYDILSDKYDKLKIQNNEYKENKEKELNELRGYIEEKAGEVKQLTESNESLKERVDIYNKEQSDLIKFKDWVQHDHYGVYDEWHSRMPKVDDIIESFDYENEFAALFGNDKWEYLGKRSGLSPVKDITTLRRVGGSLGFLNESGSTYLVSNIEFKDQKRIEFKMVNSTNRQDRKHVMLTIVDKDILDGIETDNRDEMVKVRYARINNKKAAQLAA